MASALGRLSIKSPRRIIKLCMFGYPVMRPSLTPENTTMPKRVAVLGSTGSIGTQTLDVIQAFPDKLRVTGLAAGANASLLDEQCQIFKPVLGCLANEASWTSVDSPPTEKLSGVEGLCAMASHPDVDVVVVGLVGAVGIQPTLAALQAGKTVLTANKETFVAAGHLVAPYLDQIRPIDSEHNAIYQCLAGVQQDEAKRILLTASGGPFRTWSKAEIAQATRAQALNHPNWTMGAKITIDSASMMNKGLEVIEAHWLFGMPVDDIHILVHPQSVVHSGVELIDGSVLTQWGSADMRVPIQVGFSWPRRWQTPFKDICLPCPPLSSLDFDSPDEERFPAIRLAYQAVRQGSVATAILNAANEVAVSRFLKDELTFGDITQCVEDILTQTPPVQMQQPSLEEILALDGWARKQAADWSPVLTG